MYFCCSCFNNHFFVAAAAFSIPWKVAVALVPSGTLSRHCACGCGAGGDTRNVEEVSARLPHDGRNTAGQLGASSDACQMFICLHKGLVSSRILKSHFKRVV